MKNLINLTILAAGLVLAACSRETDEAPLAPARTLTVVCPLTRTTIGYEGSDFSHLEWVEGDRVAYVTDLAGDRFKTAEVISNRFTAELPAGASSGNELHVLWPADGLEGLTLAEAGATLTDRIEQQAGTPFDGSLLPMEARATIPGSGSTVDAVYRPMASVIRIGIDPYGHEEEMLQSITLTAKEPLTGSYALQAGEWTFAGNSRTVTVTVLPSGGQDDAALLKNEPTVYMAVAPAVYTQVEMRIETDLGNYLFKDGAMEVDREGYALYRIALALEEKPEPKVTYFTQVTDKADLTPDGTYLIVSDDSESEYVTPGKKNWNSVIDRATIPFTDQGIVATDAVRTYTWKITEDAARGGYSLFSNANGLYVGSSGAIYVGDYGKFFFQAELTDSEEDVLSFYWEIDIDAVNTVIRSRRIDEAWFGYDADYNVRSFCICTPDTESGKHVKIFKLRE